MRISSRVALSLVLLGALGSSVTRDAAGQMMHGDHNPRHGGYVLMYGEDLHYEIVVIRHARVQIWLSGPMRGPLAPAIIADVGVEIERADKGRETIKMSVDHAGRCWEGIARKGVNADATLLLAFSYRSNPVRVALPVADLVAHGSV